MLINSESLPMSYLNDLHEIVQSLGELKSSIVKKRILVTGGTGFLGKWLADALVLAGAQVVVLSRSRPSNAEIEWVPADLLNPNLLREYQLLAISGIDDVIHAANDFSLTADQSLQMANQLFEIAKFSQAKRVLFISSGAVYASSLTRPTQFSESETLARDLSKVPAYGAGKVLTEREGLLRAARNEFEFKVVRGFAFFGPHQILTSHFAAAQFFKALQDDQALSVKGGGQAIRSYLYPTDFVSASLKVLFNGRASQIYNVGSKHAVKVIELARLINEYSVGGPREIVDLKSEFVSLSQSDSYVPNIDLIEKELNFRETVSLSEAVARTVRFYQELSASSATRA